MSPVSCDTSVLVPALHSGHLHHQECRARLAEVSVLTAHTLLETYRVLTGAKQLPALPPASVSAALEAFDLAVVQLPAGEYLDVVRRMAQVGRPGGAVYDAQIAATAKHHGVRLLSRDRRAAATYELIGADYELI